MLQNDLGPAFRLGRVILTPDAKKSFTGRDLVEALLRHMRGPCFYRDQEQRQIYFPFLFEGLNLGGFYKVSGGRQIFICTEADRSQTTIMSPDEIRDNATP